MGKEYEATKLTDIHLNFKPSAKKKVLIGIEVFIEYYAGSLKGFAIARNGKMKVPVYLIEYLGTKKDVPWTDDEIYQKLQTASMNTMMSDMLKALHKEGTNKILSLL